MSFRNGSSRNPPTGLAIHPPSPSSVVQPTISTPAHQTTTTTSYANLASPRRAPLPPSPTGSFTSNTGSTAPWLDDRTRGNSLDIPRSSNHQDVPPSVPNKSDKRSGYTGGPVSPLKTGKGYAGAGAYDNKLVSSTLSHLPPLPPLSPTPSGATSVLSSHPSSSRDLSHPHTTSSAHLHAPTSTTSFSGGLAATPRPSFSTPPSSSSAVVVLPDGTTLSTNNNDHRDRSTGDGSAGIGRSVIETMAHSNPSSPWSLLTVHVLPLFAGSPLKTPIEDLNHLCHSHIIGTSQRAQASRIVAMLTSDFRDFVASGMLTLKAKFETLEEAKMINRAAEVWSFFWAQVLPYLEAVFLPFTQVRDMPSTSSHSSTIPTHRPIPVRDLLLSGFLLHILLPLLPRLLPLISSPPPITSHMAHPTAPDLQRILQMSLVLSTQARYSSFVPGNERRDEEVRGAIESLGKAVRWRIQRPIDSEAEPVTTKRPMTGEGFIANRASLQRGQSMNQGRHRRRGWRASTNFGQTWGQPPLHDGVGPRQPSDMGQSQAAMDQRWGRPRVDEEEEEEVTPGQSYAYPRNTVHDTYPSSGISTMASTMASTITAGSTVRGGDGIVSFESSQRTPQPEYGMRRPMRADSESSVTPMPRR